MTVHRIVSVFDYFCLQRILSGTNVRTADERKSQRPKLWTFYARTSKHSFPPICEWRLKTYGRMCKPPKTEQIKLKWKKNYHKSWADLDLRILYAGNETVSNSNMASDSCFLIVLPKFWITTIHYFQRMVQIFDYRKYPCPLGIERVKCMVVELPRSY